MEIRKYRQDDWPWAWQIIERVFRAGETYPFSPEITEDEAYNAWVELPDHVYVVVGNDGEITGTYYIKTNQPCLGGHVCNCGYIVSEDVRCQGIATAMCEHSQRVARELGFRAMQYNLVVATNKGAIRLWEKSGFQIVGKLPGAFKSRSAGYIDAFVMYKELII